MESILTSIKKALGIQEDYEAFDSELIIHINTVFSVLHQLGVGPQDPYKIQSKENIWDEFVEDKDYLEDVKTYIYLRVRIIFDPPTNSFVLTSMENVAKELEWRLHIADDVIENLTSDTPGTKVSHRITMATDEEVDNTVKVIFG